MAKKKRYTVTVKGYYPQTCEVKVKVRSRNEENAKIMALETVRDPRYRDQVIDSMILTDADATEVWQEADIEVG